MKLQSVYTCLYNTSQNVVLGHVVCPVIPLKVNCLLRHEVNLRFLNVQLTISF
jgi:uncharacterized membrane protein YGL010W